MCTKFREEYYVLNDRKCYVCYIWIPYVKSWERLMVYWYSSMKRSMVIQHATKVNARTLWKTIHNGKIIQKLYAKPVEMSTLSFPINSSRLFIKFGLCAPSEEDNSVFIDRAGKLMKTIYRNWTANFELELCLFRLNSCSTDSNELNVEFIVDKKKRRTVNRVKSRKCLCPTATICMHTFRGKSSIERII